MASVYNLKPAFQNLLRPVTHCLFKLGITANQVTIVATLLSLVVGILLYFNNDSDWALLIVPPFLFFRMALNAIDGMLARDFDMRSNLGTILNELSDVVSDAALYLPFALVSGISSTLIVAVVVLGIVSDMAGVVSVQIGASRRYDGPMGKSDRALVFGIIALLLGLGVARDIWVNLLLTLMLLLSFVTVVNRVAKALKEVK